MSTPLDRDSRVAVIGGGPAGSLAAYFLLTLGRRAGLNLAVDIYEPRDFTLTGPAGCNMSGGIVSDRLIRSLASEGIEIPLAVVQQRIGSYVFHTSAGSVSIAPPPGGQVVTVHRGGGPRGADGRCALGVDSYLLSLAEAQGARVVPARVRQLAWEDGLPQVHVGDAARSYDLLVGAVGVNTSSGDLFRPVGLRAGRPRTTRAYVTELRLDPQAVTACLGDAVHIFLLDVPRLEFAALIPKQEVATVCLLGHGIDRQVVEAFFASPIVRECLPPGYTAGQGGCHCFPHINVREASVPFADRVVLVGDAGVTRLYKDGLRAAYVTAKAAAATALDMGVGAADFKRGYWPTYRSLARDNRYGSRIFTMVRPVRAAGPLAGGVIRIARMEQDSDSGRKAMSAVLWDLFTGNAPYRQILARMVDPWLLAQLAGNTLRGILHAGGCRFRSARSR